MSVVRKAAVLSRMLVRGDLIQDFKTVAGAYLQQPDVRCTCCGHLGKFRNFGSPIRYGAQCPSCYSVERHRLLALAVERGAISFAGKRVLHFAPEPSARKLIEKAKPSEYLRSSYPASPDDQLSLDIERIDWSSDDIDIVLCSHVLEHVDDHKALREIARVLRPEGQLIAMVPIIEGWDHTYEDKSKTSEYDRRVHFGQYDHVRYYGADFRDRVRSAGFELAEFGATGAESVQFGLLRGERIFIATKR